MIPDASLGMLEQTVWMLVSVLWWWNQGWPWSDKCFVLMPR
ncbi:hypothetical protein RESH_02569 [Rhodopirellula europaea SH398]|uniref:Uncharacterized protein n=1 Tax=Rhodopirellula europaea SH398 TaxID=1263868 RepID=M5S5S8_9BACT|nr:hypothetical protein RESH_02569 [Rhodopirellula europaea SH398]